MQIENKNNKYFQKLNKTLKFPTPVCIDHLISSEKSGEEKKSVPCILGCRNLRLNHR